MPRRKIANLKRDIGVDPRFGSNMVQRLINNVLKKGKKNIAISIVYGAFDIIVAKLGGDDKKALEVYETALEKVRPAVEVRSRRVGGGVYQIPTEVRADRATALTLRWILESARKRNDKTMSQRLAFELIEAAEGRGNAMKKKTDVHRMAEANRAFSHYSW